jgi:hypothetical protein
MTDTTASPDTTETELTPNDRRALLRKLAIGGVGAAAGAAMLGNGRVSAANGDSVNAGETVEATAPTIIDFTPGTAPTEGPSAFSVGGYVPPADSPLPAAVGGYGDDTIAIGVHGSTVNAEGVGVVAANLADGPAVGNTTDVVPTALALVSTGAHVHLLAGPDVGRTPGLHLAGELYVDNDGTLWFTVPTGTPDDVRFVKLAGTPTSGSFHAIDPQRVYDSRQPGYPAALQGVMAPNSDRVISVADGRDAGGTVTLADAVPDGATAVQINVTAANMTGPNFLSVTAGDVTTTEASLLNWSADDIQIANSITVPVDAEREIRIYNGNQAGSTDVIVDVFGYYL